MAVFTLRRDISRATWNCRPAPPVRRPARGAQRWASRGQLSAHRCSGRPCLTTGGQLGGARALTPTAKSMHCRCGLVNWTAPGAVPPATLRVNPRWHRRRTGRRPCTRHSGGAKLPPHLSMRPRSLECPRPGAFDWNANGLPSSQQRRISISVRSTPRRWIDSGSPRLRTRPDPGRRRLVRHRLRRRRWILGRPDRPSLRGEVRRRGRAGRRSGCSGGGLRIYRV